MASVGKERGGKKQPKERGEEKNHSINSWVKFSHAGALLQRQQTQAGTISACPEPVPDSPAAVPRMLRLLPQPRPLPTVPALPQAPEEPALLPITLFYLSR